MNKSQNQYFHDKSFLAEIEKHFMLKSNLRKTTRLDYLHGLLTVCKWINAQQLTEQPLTPFTLLDQPLEFIEDLTENYIRSNIETRAPKRLNSEYCAVKKWLFVNGKIKNTKVFREIDFDKSSRKTSALLEEALENSHMKQAFQICELSDKIDLGLYGLSGLRPSLIPALTVSDIYKKHVQKDNAHITLRKPCFVVILKDRQGSKAKQDVFTILPTKLTELIEIRLNQEIIANPIQDVNTIKLSDCDNEMDVYHKMRTILDKIGFKGRPYMLRKFANEILKRIETIKGDRDLKEFLMLHKGEISQIYASTALTTQKEEDYTKKYLEAVDEYINKEIFEIISPEEKSKAQLIAKFAQGLGASEEQIKALVELFEKGQLTLDALQERISELTKTTINQQIEKRFNELFDKRTNHNNSAQQ